MSAPRRVLVTGGRDYADRAHIWAVLDALHAAQPIEVLIHGAYRGADALADEWAKARKVERIPCPANWTAYGKRAGPIRNSAMLRDHSPDLVVAFPGYGGTRDMVTKAKAAGVEVFDAEVQP